MPDPLPNTTSWRERWVWVCSSPLPPKVRQTNWRRWLNRLYLGEPQPLINEFALNNEELERL